MGFCVSASVGMPCGVSASSRGVCARSGDDHGLGRFRIVDVGRVPVCLSSGAAPLYYCFDTVARNSNILRFKAF